MYMYVYAYFEVDSEIPEHLDVSGISHSRSTVSDTIDETEVNCRRKRKK